MLEHEGDPTAAAPPPPLHPAAPAGGYGIAGILRREQEIAARNDRCNPAYALESYSHGFQMPPWERGCRSQGPRRPNSREFLIALEARFLSSFTPLRAQSNEFDKFYIFLQPASRLCSTLTRLAWTLRGLLANAEGDWCKRLLEYLAFAGTHLCVPVPKEADDVGPENGTGSEYWKAVCDRRQ